VNTTDIVVINIYTNNASGSVVFGFYEAVCCVGTAWDVFVLQIQPVSATAAGAEPA
jgi:isochorismate hydrolase